jgi:hypothetical protein
MSLPTVLFETKSSSSHLMLTPLEQVCTFKPSCLCFLRLVGKPPAEFPFRGPTLSGVLEAIPTVWKNTNFSLSARILHTEDSPNTPKKKPPGPTLT